MQNSCKLYIFVQVHEHLTKGLVVELAHSHIDKIDGYSFKVQFPVNDEID